MAKKLSEEQARENALASKRKYYYKNKDKALAYAKEYYKDNKDKLTRMVNGKKGQFMAAANAVMKMVK